MPLPALPANNTDRWFLDYRSNQYAHQVRHTVSVRLDPSAGVDGANAYFEDLLNAIGQANLYLGWRVLAMRYQPAGSIVTLPAGLSSAVAAFEGTQNDAGYFEASEAIEATFQGRSPTSGRKVDFSIYGLAVPSLTTFRLSPVSGGGVQGVAFRVLAMLADAEPAPLAIDGTEVVWNQYINLNYNSYWENELRAN